MEFFKFGKKINKNKIETEKDKAKELEEVTVEYRVSIANDSRTPSETLAELSKYPSVEVKCAVARNPSTPPETLAKLGKDGSKYVKRWVALNRNTPLKTLAELMTDPDHFASYHAIRTLKNRVAELSIDDDVENFAKGN